MKDARDLAYKLIKGEEEKLSSLRTETDDVINEKKDNEYKNNKFKNDINKINSDIELYIKRYLVALLIFAISAIL